MFSYIKNKLFPKKEIIDSIFSIQIDQLFNQFRDQIVHNQISLKVPKGILLSVIGISGVGKSVLLRNIAGLTFPDKGSIYINNVDITKARQKQLAELRKKIGILFQGAALFDSMTVFENISLPLKQEYPYIKRQMISSRVNEKLDEVGIPRNVKDMLPESLSLGMKKRISLARATILNPEILLYDEPNTGLDPITSNMINNLISKLHRIHKNTSVVITHNLISALEMSDQIAILHNAKLIAIESVKQFKKNPHPHIQEFLSKSFFIR